MDKDKFKIFQEGADRYFGSNGNTLLNAYDYILSQYYAEFTTDKITGKVKFTLNLVCVPTFNQFKYFIQKNYKDQLRKKIKNITLLSDYRIVSANGNENKIFLLD